MNLELTAEQLALRDSLRSYLISLPDDVRPSPSEPTGTTDALWRGLTGMGLTGLLIPDEYGGAGATMVDAGVALEELGRALDPGPWLSTAVTVPRALSRCGVTDSAAELLGEIADGSTIATMSVAGISEPTVRALRRDGTVVLDGTVADVPDAVAAQILVVLACEGSNRALFAVEMCSSGVGVEAMPSVDSSRKQFRLTLRDAPARYLGEASSDAIDAVADDVLIASAADALGAAQALLELTIEYAKTRQQFGRAIGAFQAVAHLCVDMYETVELTRGGVIRGLWAADAGSDLERHTAALDLKSFSGHLATVGDTAIQIFGGIGYTWEHPAHRYFERLLSWSAFLGGPDRYLQELGRQLIEGVPS